MYFSKIDELEKLCPILDQADRAYAYQQFYPMKMRGEAYFNMAGYHKDGYKGAELNEQSMKIFNKILQDDFEEEMLQQYEQSDTMHMLIFYNNINTQNSENYKNVIGVKVDYIMKLPKDSAEIKLQLKELNILRRDFAVQMLTFEKFAKKNPNLFPVQHLSRLYLDIATQFRSIILNHSKNQQQNLEQSNSFLMQFVDLSKCNPETSYLFKIFENIPSQDYANALTDEIDQDPFIKKFRKDFTTDS